MPAHRKPVFVVDDHPLVREWIGTLLRQQSDLDCCGEASDAASAVAAMVAAPPEVAIVDLTLKESSGLDLIRELVAKLPSLAIVVLTMHEDPIYADQAFRAGARGYVTKHDSTHHILDAVREVSAGRVYAAPELLTRLAERMIGRTSTRRAAVADLSEREQQVFHLLGAGRTTRQIADQLHIKIKTVQAFCARIKSKLELANGAELVREAVRWTERQNRA